MTDLLFEGHEPRECGEHRTVGEHRAWCFECTEWCYPGEGCKGCRLGGSEASLQVFLQASAQDPATREVMVQTLRAMGYIVSPPDRR